MQKSHLFLFSSFLILGACGGGSDSPTTSSSSGSSNSGAFLSSGSGSASNQPASFSLSLTDGPVDSAQEVVIEFTGASIQSEQGDWTSFDFDTPQSIDLLTLQGSDSAILIEDESIPPGNYQALRLGVNAEFDSVMDSYIVLGNGTVEEIRIPSGSQTGLKLNNEFTALAGGNLDFTVDFDLRKSITNPPGQPGVLMRPTLRLIDNTEAGSLSGSIESNLLAEACSNTTENDGAVYLFTGNVQPADVSGADTDPLTTALVDENWNYEIGFLAPGDYTAAYTCENNLDEPETVEDLTFYDSTLVTILANSNTVKNFELTDDGSLSGSVDAELIAGACSDNEENDGAVYLFTGDVPPEDISGADTDPLMTVLVDDNADYLIGFLTPGIYTAAYTCDNYLDEPDTVEELIFNGTTAVTIDPNANTVQDFEQDPV